jgi:nicotinamidase-related amidase
VDAMPGVALVGDEIVFDKTGFNAFICTAIDHVLRNLGVTELVCCGVLTDECVLGTVKSACYLGYDCTVLTRKSIDR